MCTTCCSRQCNHARCAITRRADSTSGHLVKPKTRHLRCTRSLPSIVPGAADWLRGDSRLHKCPGEPQCRAQTSRSAFDCCFVTVELCLPAPLPATAAKMKLAILCLCLASMASAAPVSTDDPPRPPH